MPALHGCNSRKAWLPNRPTPKAFPKALRCITEVPPKLLRTHTCTDSYAQQVPASSPGAD